MTILHKKICNPRLTNSGQKICTEKSHMHHIFLINSDFINPEFIVFEILERTQKMYGLCQYNICPLLVSMCIKRRDRQEKTTLYISHIVLHSHFKPESSSSCT